MNAAKAKREKRTYEPEFRASVVDKLLNRGDRSVQSFAEELGIHSSVLHHWLNRHEEKLQKQDHERLKKEHQHPPRGRPPGSRSNGHGHGTAIATVLPPLESANSIVLRDRCRDLENENARLKRALQALLGNDPIIGRHD